VRPVGPNPPDIGHRPHTTTFYLGSHQPHWLATSEVPLFISHRRLRDRKTFPRARSPWALDSGGFTELNLHGRYTDGPLDYIRAIRRYAAEIGNLRWAAIQDWMCELGVRQITGRTVEEHQRLTVHNYCMIRSLWRGTPDVQMVPVLQGWDLDDYKRHYDMYIRFGVDLESEPLIGIGSVCRRGSTDQIERIIREFAWLPLHGFGLKTKALERFGHLLSSADSMAWSYQARRDEPLVGCTTHINCANCPIYANLWRRRVMQAIADSHYRSDAYQPPLDLFHEQRATFRCRHDGGPDDCP